MSLYDYLDKTPKNSQQQGSLRASRKSMSLRETYYLDTSFIGNQFSISSIPALQ